MHAKERCSKAPLTLLLSQIDCPHLQPPEGHFSIIWIRLYRQVQHVRPGAFMEAVNAVLHNCGLLQVKPTPVRLVLTDRRPILHTGAFRELMASSPPQRIACVTLGEETPGPDLLVIYTCPRPFYRHRSFSALTLTDFH